METRYIYEKEDPQICVMCDLKFFIAKLVVSSASECLSVSQVIIKFVANLSRDTANNKIFSKCSREEKKNRLLLVVKTVERVHFVWECLKSRAQNHLNRVAAKIN